MQQMAQGLASLGRGQDSMLVHMTPGEVHGLQSLAQQHGGSLTINPQTGLPEAGFLSSILPMVGAGIGIALAPTTGGASLYAMGGGALGGMLGSSMEGKSPLMGGLMGGLSGYSMSGLMDSFASASTVPLGESAFDAGMNAYPTPPPPPPLPVTASANVADAAAPFSSIPYDPKAAFPLQTPQGNTFKGVQGIDASVYESSKYGLDIPRSPNINPALDSTSFVNAPRGGFTQFIAEPVAAPVVPVAAPVVPVTAPASADISGYSAPYYGSGIDALPRAPAPPSYMDKVSSFDMVEMTLNK